MRRGKTIVLAGALLALSVSPGCASAGASAYRNHLPAGPSPEAADSDPIITGAGFDLHTAGTVSQATFDGAWKGVLATLNRYLEVGILAPLRSGGPAGDLAPFFTASAASRVASSGPDRAAFVDEGLAPAAGIRREAGVATLTALAGSDGTVSVVSARLDLRLRAQVDGDAVTIARTGELVLMPDGGAWKIDAYDLRVSRDSAQSGTTTTARSS